MVQVKQKRLIIVMILTLLLFFAETASAQPAPTVALTAQVQQAEQIVSGEVTISTTEPGLFHDQVKLSWHVYDEAGNPLVYENQRIPFTLGADNKASVPVEIDLSKLGLAPQTVTIQFDLVDEENLFWFADSTEVVLQREGVTCEIQAPQVTLRCSEGAQIVSRQLNTQVQIDFGQTDLYHEGLKLSWHTRDKNGEEIAFENERIPVPAPVDGVSTIDLSLDFKENDQLSGEKNFMLQFDLVDEVNGYWYSQNAAIDFQTEELVYQYHFLAELANTFVRTAEENPVVLLLNLIVDSAVIVGLVFYIRKRKGKNQVFDTKKSQSIIGALGKGMRTNIVLYIIVGILSVCAFISIYGIYILNPTYTDWLMVGGDLSQHYLGWTGYRNSDWMFPIGMHNSLSYPECTSIIFTDSIPLFAVFFKLLSPVLPAQFQYFGLWGLMCFVLQGIFAAKILKNHTKSLISTIIGSLIFIFSPVMLMRMFGHSALSAHWILLFALMVFINYTDYKDHWKKLIAHISLMGILSSSVHMYFVLISGIVLIGIIALDFATYKSWNRAIKMLGSYLLCVVIVVYLLGGFSSGMSVSGSSIGEYSFNLNAFINPQDWSIYLKTLPLWSFWQFEGFAYLGAGCLLLFLFAVSFFFQNQQLKLFLNKKYFIVPLILLCLIAILVAMSPTITLNDKALFTYPLPDFILKMWSIFRASGRTIWIVVYLIVFYSVIAVMKFSKKQVSVGLLALALVIQVTDISGQLKQKSLQYNVYNQYDSPLQTEDFWQTVGENEQIKQVIYTNLTQDYDYCFALTQWAMMNNKTTSSFYLARANTDTLQSIIDDALENITPECIYIFDEQTKLSCARYDLHYYSIDGMIVGYCEPIEGFQEILPSEIYVSWSFGDNQCLTENGGMDTEEGRILYPSGISFGPYWTIPAGEFQVVIKGSGLSDYVDIVLASSASELSYDYKVLEWSEKQIKVRVSIPEDVNMFEVAIYNNKNENIFLQEIQVQIAPTT